MMPKIDKMPLFPAATAEKCGGSGGKLAKPNNGGALRSIWKRGQSGDKAGAKWGQFYMMKMNSFNLFIFPDPAPHQTRPASGFAGWLCTLLELGAKGYPLAQHHPAANLSYSASKKRTVDNFFDHALVQVAQKVGTVDKVCKCLNSLNNPVNVHKVNNIAHLIRRVLC